MDGTRWLTGSGIDYYEQTDSVVEFDPNNQKVNQMPEPKKVFVVHGRDNRLRTDFFSFLRTLGLEPIEWPEALKLTGKATPYTGETIESAFKTAQAVIVLLSPDDEVRLSPDLWKDNEDEIEKKTTLQPRPNVLFEAGMAFGTHPDRTLLVEVGQVKLFSDVAGLHVVRLSNSSEKRNDIAERLKTAGCDVSRSGNDWLTTGDLTAARETKIGLMGCVPKDLTRQTLQNIDPMIEKPFSSPSNAIPSMDPNTMDSDEKGEWQPSVQYITGDSNVKYVQTISVDEARYIFCQGNVKVFFDFSVNLKGVPIGSDLAIGDVPFTINNKNIYEFNVRQTGLNHSEDLMISPRCGFSSFHLSYVTDGSEDSARFWGYITYDFDF